MSLKLFTRTTCFLNYQRWQSALSFLIPRHHALHTGSYNHMAANIKTFQLFLVYFLVPVIIKIIMTDRCSRGLQYLFMHNHYLDQHFIIPQKQSSVVNAKYLLTNLPWKICDVFWLDVKTIKIPLVKFIDRPSHYSLQVQVWLEYWLIVTWVHTVLL